MVYLKQNEVAKKRTIKPVEVKAEPAQTAERVRTGGPSDYGQYYWCVKTGLSENGEIYVFADSVEFTPTGSVMFVRRDSRINLALAHGQWSAVYAASCWDGSAVAVEQWKGEVQR